WLARLMQQLAQNESKVLLEGSQPPDGPECCYLVRAPAVSATPARNPPTWAQKATPPPVVMPSVLMPPRNCRMNHHPRMITAGIGTRKMNTRVSTRERGNKTMYAPMTPEMAPLAPSA